MEIRLPELGEGILGAEIVQWLVEQGDMVERGQDIVEVLTDKATVDLPSPCDGEIVELCVEVGESVLVGDSLLSVRQARADTTNGDYQSPATTPSLIPPRGVNTAVATRISAAPSVRRKARELNIDLETLVGSGPSGRVLMDDLQRAATASDTSSGAASAQVVGCEPRTTPLRGVRRKIAEQMVRAKATIPHYSYIDECNVSRLVEVRDELKPSFEKRGVKLTYLAFVLKAVARALADVALVNTSFDEDAGEIVFHDRSDIGIAVATERGLIVPVVRNVKERGLSEVAQEIQRLKEDARRGKSAIADLRDATFTVTSIGSIGGLVTTPIINHPEVGILGIGKIIRRPIYGDRGELRPADLMYLSFSFDHRVVDGAVGAEFSNAVTRRLEKPTSLLLQE